jgi:hypothetical protein
MKKLFILAFISLVALSVCRAQTTQGSMMLGGGISYENVSYKNMYDTDGTQTSLYFIPTFGYFVADNLAVGINLGIMSSDETEGEYDSKYTEFGVGPILRWYKPTSNEDFSFFLQASVMYSMGNETYSNGFAETEIASSQLDIGVSPGFAYFFNEHWSAEIAFRGIGVSAIDPNKDAKNDNITSFVFGINSFAPSLGVRFYF